MNKSNYILIILFLINSLINYSQELYELKGELKFINDTNIVRGNAILLSAVDTSFIKSVNLEIGKFTFNQIIQNKAILKIQLFEFAKYDSLILVNLTSSNTDLGIIKIHPKAEELNGVTVSSKAPLFESKPDGTYVINVSNSILTASTSVTDLLSKSPNIYIDENGISVVGKGRAIIYLNNKRIIASQLSSVQVSQVKKIEIITNPSSRYDSDGKAVINLITFKSQYEGVQGSTNMEKHLLSNTSFNLNWKKKKWSTVINYGQDLGTNWETNKMRREVNSNLGHTISENNFEDNSKVKYVSNYLIGIGYDIDSTSFITLEYMGDTHLNNQNSIANTSFLNLTNETTNI